MNGHLHLLLQEELPPGQYSAKVRSAMHDKLWSEWTQECDWYIDDKSDEIDVLSVAIPLSCIVVLTLIIMCHLCCKKLKQKHWEMIPNPSKSQLARKNFITPMVHSSSTGNVWTSDQEALCVEVLQVTNKRAFNDNSHQTGSIEGDENENQSDTSFVSRLSLSESESCFQQQWVNPSMLTEESPENLPGPTVLCDQAYKLFSKLCAVDEIISNTSGFDHNSVVSCHKTEKCVSGFENLVTSVYKGFESCIAEGLALAGSHEDEHGITVKFN